MKIAELIADYSKIVKKSSHKLAFVPNPEVAAQQQQQQQQQQAAQQQAQTQPQQAPPQAPQAPAAPQQPQQAPPQGGQGGSLMDEVMAVVQQLPPEVQQQIAPMLQQLQSLPPDQREQHLAELLQQLQQGGGQPQGQPQGQPLQAPPQQGMVAQASEEDLYAAMQGMQPGGEAPPMEPPQDTSTEDAAHAEASAVEAKNELDNVRVSLTVRELLDLVGKGTATASLLKVKQLADTHKQKMDQNKQKADSAQQEQTQKSQEAQQGMMGGGIYPTPMGAQ